MVYESPKNFLLDPNLLQIDFDSLKLSVNTKDRSKVGIHIIEIEGSPLEYPKLIEKYMIELEVIDPCYNTKLKIYDPGELTYTIG